jgi:hypothetical protein
MLRSPRFMKVLPKTSHTGFALWLMAEQAKGDSL